MEQIEASRNGPVQSDYSSILSKIWPLMVAGLVGSAAHYCLMILKSRAGLLASFQPYDDLQRLLGDLLGGYVGQVAPWLLSFANGSVLLGFVFGRTYRILPGRTGAVKGLVFGFIGWVVMGLIFFPLLGRGLFATGVGLGPLPAAFSLMMVLTYSTVMGAAYSILCRT